MRARDLAKYFYDWGWEIKHEYFVAFSDYLKEMLKRQRVIVIQNGEEVEAIIFFFLTHDFGLLYKKRTWDIVEDESDGSQIYIDKMVCRKFTKALRKELQDSIESKFPNVNVGVYHRAPKDRCIKIYSRRIHV